MLVEGHVLAVGHVRLEEYCLAEEGHFLVEGHVLDVGHVQPGGHSQGEEHTQQHEVPYKETRIDEAPVPCADEEATDGTDTAASEDEDIVPYTADVVLDEDGHRPSAVDAVGDADVADEDEADTVACEDEARIP